MTSSPDSNASRDRLPAAFDDHGDLAPDSPKTLWRLWLLPSFIDMLQHRAEGDRRQAALAALPLLSLTGELLKDDLEAMCRLTRRIEWVIATQGVEPLREVATQARDLPLGPERTAKVNELLTMLSLRDVDARVDEILIKLESGQTPTERDIWILKIAKGFYEREGKSQS